MVMLTGIFSLPCQILLVNRSEGRIEEGHARACSLPGIPSCVRPGPLPCLRVEGRDDALVIKGAESIYNA